MVVQLINSLHLFQIFLVFTSAFQLTSNMEDLSFKQSILFLIFIKLFEHGSRFLNVGFHQIMSLIHHSVDFLVFTAFFIRFSPSHKPIILSTKLFWEDKIENFGFIMIEIGEIEELQFEYHWLDMFDIIVDLFNHHDVTLVKLISNLVVVFDH